MNTKVQEINRLQKKVMMGNEVTEKKGHDDNTKVMRSLKEYKGS